MKTKIFGGIAIVAIALAVAFNVSLNTSTTNNASLLALANVEALASGEEFTITCDTKGSGYCYYVRVEEGLFGACRFDCAPDGSRQSYCSSCWVDLVNFCSAMSCGS